jgi:hypothetical protein
MDVKAHLRLADQDGIAPLGRIAIRPYTGVAPGAAFSS